MVLVVLVVVRWVVGMAVVFRGMMMLVLEVLIGAVAIGVALLLVGRMLGRIVGAAMGAGCGRHRRGVIHRRGPPSVVVASLHTFVDACRIHFDIYLRKCKCNGDEDEDEEKRKEEETRGQERKGRWTTSSL